MMKKYDVRKLSTKKTIKDKHEYITYTITIPSEWIQDSKLLPGDLLLLEGNENQLILKIWGRQNDKITKLVLKSVTENQIRIFCPCENGEYIVNKKPSLAVPNWSIIEKTYSTCSSCKSKYEVILFDTSGGKFIAYFLDKHEMPKFNEKLKKIENKDLQHHNKNIEKQKLMVQNAHFMTEFEFNKIKE